MNNTQMNIIHSYPYSQSFVYVNQPQVLASFSVLNKIINANKSENINNDQNNKSLNNSNSRLQQDPYLELPIPFVYHKKFPDLMDQKEEVVKHPVKAFNKSASKKKSSQHIVKIRKKHISHRKANMTTAYKRRNIYKSIIRRIFRYMDKEADSMREILLNNYFVDDQIKEAFQKIGELGEYEKQNRNSRQPQKIINEFLEKKCIYTYILKEVLSEMIKDLMLGENSKMIKRNKKIYLELCTEYYNRCCELIT